MDAAKEARKPVPPEEFLHKELTRHLADYKRKQVYNRFATAAIRGLLILAGAVTTVLLGVKSYAGPAWEARLSIAALVISASATALGAWEAFAQHSQKWVRARITLGELHEIGDDLSYAMNTRTPLEEPLVAELFARMKATLHANNEQWSATRARAITAPPKTG